MTDDPSDRDLDALLRDAGAQFRAAHDQPAVVDTTVRGRVRSPLRGFAPVVAAAAAVVVAVGVPVALTTFRNGDPETSAARDPAVSGSAPLTSVPLQMADVNDVALDDDWIIVSGGDVGEAARQRIEVRRRDDPTRVVTTIQTRFKAGGPTCVAVTRDVLLWTDSESIASDLVPGPATRWGLWERNLQTGVERQLAASPTDLSGDLDQPCAVTGRGLAVWSDRGRVTVRDLALGTSATTADTARPVAVTASGIVEVEYGQNALPIVLRPAPAFAERRILTSVPGGTSAAAGGEHILVFAREPGSVSADAAIVSACTLPSCADLVELRRDPSSAAGVVGDGFAAWSHLADSPTVLRFDGRSVPEVAPGFVPFQSLAAFRDTLAYVTQPEGQPAILRVQRIGTADPSPAD